MIGKFRAQWDETLPRPTLLDLGFASDQTSASWWAATWSFFSYLLWTRDVLLWILLTPHMYALRWTWSRKLNPSLFAVAKIPQRMVSIQGAQHIRWRVRQLFPVFSFPHPTPPRLVGTSQLIVPFIFQLARLGSAQLSSHHEDLNPSPLPRLLVPCSSSTHSRGCNGLCSSSWKPQLWICWSSDLGHEGRGIEKAEVRQHE